MLPDREVPPALILGDITPEQERKWVLADKRNPLGAWQDKGALDHWKGEVPSRSYEMRLQLSITILQ